jgi:hypothetical protein
MQAREKYQYETARARKIAPLAIAMITTIDHPKLGFVPSGIGGGAWIPLGLLGGGGGGGFRMLRFGAGG